MTRVFFDFDKTLTRVDTVTPFGLYFALMTDKYVRAGFLCIDAVRAKFGKLSNLQFKERFLQMFAADRTEAEVEKISEAFLRKYGHFLLREKIFCLLQRHQAKGDSVWLVSAHFDFFLRPLKEMWGVDGIIATQAETSRGRFTGRVRGNVCRGQEKAERVLSLFGPEEVGSAVAYGDSGEDLHLLGLVSEGYLVTPDGLIRLNASRAAGSRCERVPL